MNTHSKYFNAVVLLTLLLAACGNPNDTSTLPASAPASQAAVVAGMASCTECHTTDTADWLTSKHANLAPGSTVNSPGIISLAQIASCTTNCHDPNGDSMNLIAGYTGNVPRPVVGCEACHGPGSLHASSGGHAPLDPATAAAIASYAIPVSNQYVICTSCHELLNTAGTGTVMATHASGGSVPLPPSGSSYTITKNHFAVASSTFNASTIQGYVMNYASETVCTDCHSNHKPANAEREWAMSIFGNMASGGWYRNWSQSPYCQRCHTSSGFVALADSMIAGNAALTQQIILGTLSTAPVPSASTWAPEMILCWACHTDNNGTILNPGPFTANYSYNYYTLTPVNYSVAYDTYPDAGNSNVCMPCHVGRQGGDSIKNMNVGAVTAEDFSNSTLLGAHNSYAGGTMFRLVGYNYAGRDYSNPSGFMMDQIGTPNSVPASGTNGPCVRCHMTGTDGQSHHLFPVVSSTTTTVLSSTTTTINGVSRIVITNLPYGICSTCHTTDAVTFMNFVSQKKNNYIDAQSAVGKVLESVNIYRRGTSFYPARNYQTISAGTATATNGSTTVLGTKTNWLATGLDVGDFFRIDADGTWYAIASINSATQITLASAFTTTPVGGAYTIRKNETVSVVTGTTTVTGNGTNWISNTGMIAAGDKFRIDSYGTYSTWFTIASVNTDTQLVLTANYPGPSTTTAGFTLKNSATAVVSGTTVTVMGANLITLDVYAGADYFRIDSDQAGAWYLINARTANTLTLANVYTGPTGTLPFTIIRNNANREWLMRGDLDISGNTTGKNTMGAAFNLMTFVNSSYEPAAYVHNASYAKKLLYDSIDWLDDGVLNYSSGTTLNSLCTGSSVPVWCTGAMNYLLPNGVIGSGAADERP